MDLRVRRATVQSILVPPVTRSNPPPRAEGPPARGLSWYPSTWVGGVAIGAVVYVFLWHCWLTNYVVDDAFITFGYARNFARGLGLVFNPGDYVEGYSNFLWTVMLSGVARLAPQSDLLPVAQGLGIAFGLATLLAVARFSSALRGGLGGTALVAPAFLALQAPFVAWSTGALETTLFAFLVFTATVAYVRAVEADAGYAWPSVLFALATLTRPDGLVFFGAASLAAISLNALWGPSTQQS